MSTPENTASSPMTGGPGPQPSGRPPGPDLLRRVATLPTTGTRGARFIRDCFRRRRKHPSSTVGTADGTHLNGRAVSAPEASALTVDEILDTIYPEKKEFEEGEDDLEYDGLATYLQTREDEKALVTREVERLVDIVKNPDTPLVLDGGQRLGGGDTVGYAALTILTKMLSDAKSICLVDNDGISLVHAPIGHTAESYRGLIHRLQNICERGEIALPTGSGAVWATAEERREDAAALMDFLSACLARYATQIADGTSWRNQQLGALARFTAKVKFLLEGMADHASTALRNAEIALATFEATYGEEAQRQGAEKDDQMAVYRRFAATLSGDPAQADYMKGVEHRVNQQRARAGFMGALKYVLASLRSGNRHRGFGVTEYEVCGVVMETGFQDFQTLLFQDRDFEYTSTSNGDQMNFAHPAFRMLDASISYLQRTKEPPQNTRVDPRGTQTKLEWMYSDSDGAHGLENGAGVAKSTPSQPYTLQTMREIVTVMVPLALAAPVVSGRYKHFLDMWYLTHDADDVVRPFPERPFKAFVRLYTSDFEAARRQRLPDDVLQLADAVRTGLFSRTSLLNASHGTKEDDASRDRLLAETHRLMDSWVYTEDAVVVQCGLYVWSVMLAAGVLVAGGLAIGLTVQDRLTGVDPFNITVYAWALAAFMVLISKAAMVEDWPWCDFLHRRVKCRSVSELRAVTGINDQLITAKLLHDEQDSVLTTRGPFNIVFLRKAASGSGGFAIDVPIQNKTLLLSGLVMIKVETTLGNRLVCLDVRRGTELSVVEHRDVGNDTERLISQDIGKTHQGDEKTGRKISLKSGKLEWRRVEGVYNVLDAAFV
ncbi:hypothetical protein MAPG_11283 [Magnaporthiopsis poae ATCC 64411]|uniref:Uncharacterized protein n=1 Tax=Magnaporthiopsis poae (strain ATCC 64411 / 73-15) TaxID=644358 RepID=A0A0C4EEV2_MAGP6|nr:hypothetical protein MAPG_11283 [Magnaporthiopsis poae ATCC 64411]